MQVADAVHVATGIEQCTHRFEWPRARPNGADTFVSGFAYVGIRAVFGLAGARHLHVPAARCACNPVAPNRSLVLDEQDSIVRKQAAQRFDVACVQALRSGEILLWRCSISDLRARQLEKPCLRHG